MSSAATAVNLPSTALSHPQMTLRAMYTRLTEAYGPQHWWPAKTPIEVVVGAYLTQNTSWRNVERSIANLEAAGVLAPDGKPDGLRAIDIEALRIHIRPSGYMVRKALALKAFVALLDRDYLGALDALAEDGNARAALLDLPGVGPETADAIVLYALGQPVMVVDEYLRRVTTRHGLIAAPARGLTRYNDVQALALAAFADDDAETLLAHYNEFHALIVMVGKTHCGGVPRCQGCPLNQPRFHPPLASAR